MASVGSYQNQKDLTREGITILENKAQGRTHRKKWKKVVYGGMQPGYDDNYTDDSFLEAMVMNANVVKRDLFKVMLDSISISQYLCIVTLVVTVWTQALCSSINEITLLSLDFILLFIGFSVILLTTSQLSLQLLFHFLLKVSFFISGVFILAPVYYTLTRSISSDSIYALSVVLLVVHLFLHDYSGCTIRLLGSVNNPTLVSNISLNASIVSSVLVASRLPSTLHVFTVMLFSLQGFLFAPLLELYFRKYSFRAHLWFSLVVMGVTLSIVYTMQKMLFVLLLSLLIFVSVVCPHWLIRIQEYKCEINGPWDVLKYGEHPKDYIVLIRILSNTDYIAFIFIGYRQRASTYLPNMGLNRIDPILLGFSIQY